MIHPVRALFVSVERHRVCDRLRKDGFALVGGDPTPLSADEAKAAAARLTDAHVVQAGVIVGAPLSGDGPILTLLRQALAWIEANPDKVVSFLLTILMSLLAI